MSQSDKLTIRDAARSLDVDERTVRRWIKSGQLPHTGYDLRGRYLILRSDLEAFVRRREQEGTGRSKQD